VAFTCSGGTYSDESECVPCANLVAVGNETDASKEEVAKLCGTASEFPLSAIVATIGGCTLAGTLLIFCIVRKRRAMKQKMAELVAANKDMENGLEISQSLEHNINPMLQRGQLAAVERLHEEEMDALNRHRRALEEEIFRLKKEAQQNQALRQTGPLRAEPKRRKEFRHVDTSL